jgi:hypothetical protein
MNRTEDTVVQAFYETQRGRRRESCRGCERAGGERRTRLLLADAGLQCADWVEHDCGNAIHDLAGEGEGAELVQAALEGGAARPAVLSRETESNHSSGGQSLGDYKRGSCGCCAVRGKLTIQTATGSFSGLPLLVTNLTRAATCGSC